MTSSKVTQRYSYPPMRPKRTARHGSYPLMRSQKVASIKTLADCVADIQV